MNNYIFPFLWMRGESEEVIRTEIEKIAECGIRAVCVEARPHNDFCGPGWWHDMDIVIDEAKKRGMKIWILDDKHFPTGYAAGLIETKYPERKKWYIADTTADIFGSQHPLTINVKRMLKPVIGYWQLGEPADYEERAKNELLAVVACQFTDSDTFTEETINLTGTCKDGTASFTLPEGQWRVHVIYKTRTDGGNEDYINMLDKVSAHTQIEGVYEAHYEHYKDEFGKTIAGFFSDEPELGNTKDVAYDAKVGKKGLALPWSDELEGMLKERYGDDYKRYLPFLFTETDTMELCPQMRYDYMDCVSRLYEKNFSKTIGDWCREHGAEYIGHVVEDNGTHSRTGHGPGHWFRAMAGQDMAGIDVIGSQVIFGAPAQTRSGMGGMDIDGEFFHYILGKLGASSGHLDPKKKGRTMCELFGAYGWNFGVRNMKYLLDHLLCKGVNYLVPHAFSMAEYPDIDCPPHFYARGNNPQFMWFARLMKYANRMCGILNNGTHIASVALLYDGEADWTGTHMPMQKAGRELIRHQIEFDVVCIDMLKCLKDYNGKIENKKLIINGVTFDCLVIPYMEYMPYELAGFLEKNSGFPVYFVGGWPRTVLKNAMHDKTASMEWKHTCKCLELPELAATLKADGMKKITLEPAFSKISMYHYKKQEQILMLMNESAEDSYKGVLQVPGIEEVVYYDAMKDCYKDIHTEVKNGIRQIPLMLEPGESCIIMEKKGHVTTGIYESFETQISNCQNVINLKDGWRTELASAKEYPGFSLLPMGGSLVPVSDIKPDFSGIIRYTKDIDLDKVPQRACLKVQHVYEVLKLTVNDTEAGICLTPPYQMEIQNYLKAGKNKLVIEVANTPGRDQMNYPMPPFDFSHEALEPSGMFGDILLYYS